MKIELFSRRNLFGMKRWYFRLVAKNGETVAQSEGYSRRFDALDTAHLIKEEAAIARVVSV